MPFRGGGPTKRPLPENLIVELKERKFGSLPASNQIIRPPEGSKKLEDGLISKAAAKRKDIAIQKQNAQRTQVSSLFSL